MKLYKVEEEDNPSNVHYYWAENMREALKHNASNHDIKTKCRAEQVWADNTDMRWRGYVRKDDQDES